MQLKPTIGGGLVVDIRVSQRPSGERISAHPYRLYLPYLCENFVELLF